MKVENIFLVADGDDATVEKVQCGETLIPILGVITTNQIAMRDDGNFRRKCIVSDTHGNEAVTLGQVIWLK